MSITPAVHAVPQTLRGIKRKAKTLKGPEVTHLQALDLAAQDSGYQSFHHARRVLEKLTAELPMLDSIYLSAYWHDRNKKPSEAGLEVIRVDLPRPMLSFLTKYQIAFTRNLSGFRVADTDHLEMSFDADSQERAKELLHRAALALQFVEATGLRPVTTQAQRKKLSRTETLPRRDHISWWVDPTTERCVALDEPYDHVNRTDEVTARSKWADQNDFHISKPVWPGLYYPNNAVPHFVGQDGDWLSELTSIVEKLPAPQITTVTREGDKPGFGYYARFASPATEASGRKRKPRLGTTYGYSKGATELFRRAGEPIKWRPKTGLAISKHKELSKELKSLCISPMNFRANQVFEKVRSTLEDWMYAEHPAETRNSEFYNTYYGDDAECSVFRSTADQVAAIERLQTLLMKYYEDSKPKRDLLKSIQQAMAGMQKSLAA
ncbi:DUF5623 domain-containing protein [Pseudomonas argentinensis]|uniref:DUF5623 domain-containing protein n=1 Tax=Phytopseudomonas argentinensis TaxID=289370 RepID=UPI0008A9EFBD|nr:DUF5623 domain-containing protein [Pseudomonas argentinensis]